jgi:hypothetical protein
VARFDDDDGKFNGKTSPMVISCINIHKTLFSTKSVVIWKARHVKAKHPRFLPFGAFVRILPRILFFFFFFFFLAKCEIFYSLFLVFIGAGYHEVNVKQITPQY